MKNEKIVYAVGGLIVGGLAVWLITLINVNPNIGMMGSRTSMNQNSQRTDALDAHFIEQMIPHHEDAIVMAKLAQTKAQRPEIKQLAEDIISSQGTEISQMKSWYKSWFGKDVPEGGSVMNQHGMGNGSDMHMGMMGNNMDMARLENAQDFDKVFIEDMIPHHQMAVMMASMLKGGTQRPEMKELADDIVAAQTKEIEQMRQWYTDWGYEK